EAAHDLVGGQVAVFGRQIQRARIAQQPHQYLPGQRMVPATRKKPWRPLGYQRIKTQSHVLAGIHKGSIAVPPGSPQEWFAHAQAPPARMRVTISDVLRDSPFMAARRPSAALAWA